MRSILLVIGFFLFLGTSLVFAQISINPTITGSSRVCLNQTYQYSVNSSGGQWSIIPQGAGRISIVSTGGSTVGSFNSTVRIQWNNPSISTAQVVYTARRIRTGEDVEFQRQPSLFNVTIIGASPNAIIQPQTTRPGAICLAAGQTSYTYRVVEQPGTAGILRYEWEISPANQGVIISGQDSPQIQVQWNNALAGQSVKIGVRTHSTLCRPSGSTEPETISPWREQSYPFVAELSVLPTAGFQVDGQAATVSPVLCSGSTHRFELVGVSGAVAYQWSFPADAKVVYQPGNQAVDVTLGKVGGTISVTAVNGCGENRSFSLPVQVAFPFSLAKVEGPLLVCAGRSYTYQVPLVLGASYNWQVPQGASIISGQGSEQVQLVFSENAFRNGQQPRLSVTASSRCNLQPITVQSAPIAQRSPVAVANQLFSFMELAAPSPSKSLLLNTCQQLDVALCQQRQISKANLKVVFSTGDLHQLPIDTKFNQNLQFTLRAYDIQGQLIAGFPAAAVTLAISEQTPEAVYTLNFTAWHSQISRLEVLPLLTGTPVSNTVVQQALQLKAFYEEQFSYSGQISPIVLETVTDPGNGSYERLFSWQATACPSVGSYQLQVLRLYEAGTDSKNGGETLQGADWSKALSIETESSVASYQLTVAEGSGRYVWRVRAIGNQEGGIANPKNWGEWSVASEFSFVQPDEGTQAQGPGTNWIYSRTFTEGGRVSEKMSFANGLGQIAQVQAKIQSQEQVIISETRQDYIGRDALQTLPVPVTDKTTLGYVPDFMKVKNQNRAYQKNDFDSDDTYKEPNQATAGNYYSGQDVTNSVGEVVNAGVPSDGGYPYSRTRYNADGTSRVVEQGGVGADHHIGTTHTVKTAYTGVSDAELLQLFGKEAPAAANVHKVITSDPNGTSSVSYQTKDGKTIATALINTRDVNNPQGALDPLESAGAATKTITEVLTERTPFGGIGTRTSKPIVFSVPTTLTIDYKLTPQQLSDICNTNSCQSCDYRIQILVIDSETQNEIKSEILSIPMAECRQPETVRSIHFTLEGLEGSFVVEKRISAYNRKELADGSSLSYLDEQLKAIEQYYSAESLMQGGDWQGGDWQGGDWPKIHSLLQEEKAKDLYGFLDFKEYTKQAYPLEEEQPESERKYYYEVPLSIGNSGQCSQIQLRIPYIETVCPAYNCDFFNIKTGKEVANPAATMADYWQTKTGIGLENQLERITRSEWDSDLSDFNQMILNMVADGYSCEDLWNCWQQAVDNYADGIPGLPDGTFSGSSGNPTLKNQLSTAVPDVLTSFFQCVGVERTRLISWSGSGVLPQAERERYYKLILLNSSLPTYNTCVSGSGLDLSSLPLELSRVLSTDNEQEKQEKQEKLKKAQTLAGCLQYSKTDPDPSNSNGDILKGLVLEKLQSACQGRYEDFRAQVIQTIRRNGRYIQPDPTRSITKDQPNPEGDYYYLLKDEQGQLVSDPMTGLPVFSDIPLPANFSYQYQLCQIDQMAQALVDYCLRGATAVNLELASRDDRNVSESERLQILAAREQIERMLLGSFYIGLDGANCGEGYDVITPRPIIIRRDPTPAYQEIVLRKVLQVDGYPTNPTARQGFTVPHSPLLAFSNAFSASFWVLKRNGTQAELVQKYSSSVQDGWGIEMYGNKIRVWVTNRYITTNVKIENHVWTHIVVTNSANELKIYKNGMLAATYPSGVIKDNPSYTLQSGFGVVGLGSLNGYLDEMALFNKVLTDEQISLMYSKGKGTSSTDLQAYIRQLTPSAYWNFDQGTGLQITDQSGNRNTATLRGYSETQTLAGADNHWRTLSKVPLDANALVAYWGFEEADGSTVLDRSCHGYHGQLRGAVDRVSTGKVGKALRGLGGDATQNAYMEVTGMSESLRNFSVGFWIKPYGGEHSNIVSSVRGWGQFTWLMGAWGQVLAGTSAATRTGGYDGNNTLESIMEFNAWQHICFTFSPNQSGVKGTGRLYKNGELVFEQLQMDIPSSVWGTFYLGLPMEAGTTYRPFTSLRGEMDEVMIFNRVLSQTEVRYLVDQGESGTTVTNRNCPAPSSCAQAGLFCFKWGQSVVTTDLTPPKELADYVQRELPRSLPCEQTRIAGIWAELRTQLAPLQEEKKNGYREQYQSTCVAQQGLEEEFKLSYSLGYHHYTLYYYDRAGNLVRTVPPQGVELLPVETSAQQTTAAQSLPAHSLVTSYTYNSIGQLVQQHTPDGGTTQFYYNNKSQLRFSQNEKQVAEGYYSYTRYDELGRVTEVGESQVSEGLKLASKVEQMSFPTSSMRQVTKTVYSDPADGIFYEPAGSLASGQGQRYLQNRVSYSYLDEDGNESTIQDQHRSYYSYDVHGNVEWLVQQLPGLESKYIRYEYDLISGKVLRVNYQENQADQFYHRYGYDEDNRLTGVETSHDGVIWEKDATYNYYRHGPLKRMELGEDRVQGVDYTYTLQGWLKAINHPDLTNGSDPGKDGGNSVVPPDAFGMGLTYYNGDYVRTGGIGLNQTGIQSAASPLYNGNIAAWTTQTAKSSAAGNLYEQLTAEQYRYDDLNRIKSSSFSAYENGQFVAKSDYATSYSYDANGNLLTLNRNAYGAQLQMDKLTYQYYSGTNKLKRVEDDFATPALADDIENQTGDSEGNNYIYDGIGNLIDDKQENIEIEWTVYGKVKKVQKKDNSQTIVYLYDATGNRTMKTVSRGSEVKTTYYVRDASGNVMSVYEKSQSTAVAQSEVYLYGSSRLGVYRPQGSNGVSGMLVSRQLQEKEYELVDHLGNVRAVIGDYRQADGTNPIRAALRSYANYYAFGMNMPGRNYFGTGQNRYGFNGKEIDRDFGNVYDYGFRIYDPRIGKFLSVDPLASKYPELTPYQFASNRPIDGIDLDGLEYASPGQIGTDLVFFTKKHTDKEIAQHYRTKVVTGALSATAGLAYVGLASSPFLRPTAVSIVAWANANPAAVKEIGSFGAGVVNGLAGYDGMDLEGPADDIGRAGGRAAKHAYEGMETLSDGIRMVEQPLVATDFVRMNIDAKGVMSWSYGQKVLGLAEVKDGQVLSMFFDIPEELQKLGIGSKMFDDAMKVYGDKITIVEGYWRAYSENYKAYRKSGDLFRTPTGGWAEKYKYTVSNLLQDTENAIHVWFTKPKPPVKATPKIPTKK